MNHEIERSRFSRMLLNGEPFYCRLIGRFRVLALVAGLLQGSFEAHDLMEMSHNSIPAISQFRQEGESAFEPFGHRRTNLNIFKLGTSSFSVRQGGRLNIARD
jgi:hypothetical protein